MDGEKDLPSKDLREKLLLEGAHHTACRILVPRPGIKPKPLAVEVFTTAPPGKSREERFCQKKASAKVLRWAWWDQTRRESKRGDNHNSFKRLIKVQLKKTRGPQV